MEFKCESNWGTRGDERENEADSLFREIKAEKFPNLESVRSKFTKLIYHIITLKRKDPFQDTLINGIQIRKMEKIKETKSWYFKNTKLTNL